MKQWFGTAAIALAAFGIGMTAAPASAAVRAQGISAAAVRTLTLEAMRGQRIGALSPGSTVKVHVLLYGRNENQLERFIQMQNTPGSSVYRQYLTPQQFGNMFGADRATYARSVAMLRAYGFTIDELANNRRDIVAHAPAAVVSRFFATPIDLRTENGRTFYAARYEPLIPSGLPAELVSGLNDYRVLHSHMTTRPQQIINNYFSWSPADVALAYDLDPLYSHALTGKGITIANATSGAASPTDFAQFQSIFKVPGSTLVSTPIDGALSEVGNGESTLDLDWATATARGATFHQVVAHSAAGNDFDDVYKYIVDSLGASTHVVTTSWGACEPEQAGSEVALDESYFKQAAAEGQWWFAAAGDGGTDDCGYGYTTKVSVDFPGSSPYVVSVGGTDVHATISTAGLITKYNSESVWEYGNCTYGNGYNSNGAGGGGKSAFYPKPAYQTALTPKDGRRDVPDVSLLADDVNDGLFIYQGRLRGGNGGTSEAAPQWAGLMAIIEQKKANYKNVQDPHYRLYALAASSSHALLFHDVIGGNNGVPACAGDYGHVFAGYNAIPGYDTASGIGSYIGASLVDAY